MSKWLYINIHEFLYICTYTYYIYRYVYHPMPLDSGNSRFFKFSINGLMTIPQYGYVVQFLTQAHEQCSKPPLVDDCKGLHGITLLVYIGDDKNPIVGIPINQPCIMEWQGFWTPTCIVQDSSFPHSLGPQGPCLKILGSVNAFRIAGPVLPDWGTLCDVHFTVATENWVNVSLNPMLIGFCNNMGLYQISNHNKHELENNYWILLEWLGISKWGKQKMESAMVFATFRDDEHGRNCSEIVLNWVNYITRIALNVCL